MTQLTQNAAAGISDGARVNPSDTNAETGSAQFLTFLCDGEEYGIDILRVQEIKGWESATRVPHAAPYVLGVMNLRGMIVPVINLRTRFGLADRPFDASTVVIVVKMHGADRDRTVGIVVDAVSEVYGFTAAAIKPPPAVGGRADGACISGIATTSDRKMVMLLDIDRLIDVKHVNDVRTAVGQ
jgi:purine-binding chemotaxis protein CheW